MLVTSQVCVGDVNSPPPFPLYVIHVYVNSYTVVVGDVYIHIVGIMYQYLHHILYNVKYFIFNDIHSGC